MTETHHKNPNKGNLHRISCTGQGTHILARGSCTAVSTEILAGRSCTRPSTLHTGRFQKLPWYFFAVLLQWPLPSHLLGVCVPPSLSSRSSIFLLPCSLRLAAGEDSETVQSVRLWLFLFNPNFGRFKMVRPPVVLPLCGWLTESYPCRLRFAWFNPRFAKEQGLT